MRKFTEQQLVAHRHEQERLVLERHILHAEITHHRQSRSYRKCGAIAQLERKTVTGLMVDGVPVEETKSALQLRSARNFRTCSPR